MAPAAGPTSEAPALSRPLFEEVAFHIVLSDKLLLQEANEVSTLMLENGAQESASRESAGQSRTNIDLEEVTHIIARDINFLGYADAERNMIPVVTPEWARVSVQRGRLAHVRLFTPDPRFFFSGVVATVAELPPGDKEAICGGVIAMGGQYSNHLTKMTTHVVALDMDNDKCKQVREKNLKNAKIVLPHWFDDCLKLGRRIREEPYLLPNAEIQMKDSIEHIDIPVGPDMSYSHSHPEGPPRDQPPMTRGATTFDRKKVMLGSDLGLSLRLHRVICGIIVQAKGEVVQRVDDANVYVGHWREGEEYLEASQKGFFVGNLTWLYWMFAHGQWTNPLTRLLHYPVARGGLPGMSQAMITVSNYGGEARLYLENLIEAAGARFTKSMKAENTHLITARAHSEKCTAAKEWNIHMINHLWLEESYAKWEVQSLTNPRYTHFPRRTNLTEVIGKTSIDPKALEQFYIKEDTPILMENVPAMTLKIQNTREIDSPSVLSSGRRAKEQAVARLHDEVAPDLLLYDKERKRKGGLLGGRRRTSNDSPERPKKRLASLDGGTDEEGQVSKKGKKRPKPTIHLLITAYRGWLEHPEREDGDKKTLADAGIQCVLDPAQCTHLAAPQIVRTEKFCCALAKAPIVVSTDWVEACIRSENIVETQPYLLKDPDGEKRLKVNLADSLLRAGENKGHLLRGQAIYCTPGVHGGYETCRHIVEANGGVCVSFRLMKRAPNTPDSEIMVLLSGDDPVDRKLCRKFQGFARASGKEAYIYRADWLLDLAMTQIITWSSKYAVVRREPSGGLVSL